MNRIADAIGKMRNNPRLPDLDEDKLAITFREHFGYQTAQSTAHASGKLTLEEAQICYIALGEGFNTGNGGWASGVDKATKIVVTRVMGELILK